MGGVNDGAFRPNESGVEGPQKGQQVRGEIQTPKPTPVRSQAIVQQTFSTVQVFRSSS